MNLNKCTLVALAAVALAGLYSLAATPSSAEPEQSQTAEEELTTLLHEFLAASGEAEMHERFWTDDLIYTSSRGTRFGKADIMAGFAATADSDDAGDDTPSTVFTGEDVQIRVLGSTAVVAFKLVGTPPDDSPLQNYLNTGTFVKRDGEWRAIAWQATISQPSDTPESGDR